MPRTITLDEAAELLKTTADINQQIACVDREIGLRKRAYPRWIQLGKMTQAVAEEQIACMEAVRVTLQNLRDERRAKVEPPLF